MRSAHGANMIVLVDVGLKMTPHVSGNTDTIGNKRLRRCTLGCVRQPALEGLAGVRSSERWPYTACSFAFDMSLRAHVGDFKRV